MNAVSFALILVAALASPGSTVPASAPAALVEPSEGASPTGDLAPDEPPFPSAEWLRVANERVRPALDDFEKRAGEAESQLARVKGLSDGGEWATAWADYLASFPGHNAAVAVLGQALEEAPSAQSLRATVKQARDALREQGTCLTATPPARRTACAGLVKNCAAEGLESKAGQVRAVMLDADVRVTYPRTPDLLFPRGPRPFNEAWWQHAGRRRLAVCSALAEAGIDFTPTAFAKAPMDPPAWTNPYVSVFDLSSLKASCTWAPEEIAAQSRLLAASVGPLRDAWPLTFWRQLWTERRRRCAAEAERLCARVYFIKDVPALAYATQGCEIRRVTARDVQDDLRLWKLAGITEADRLQHALLLDTLDACGAVGKAIDWPHSEPELSEECRQAKKEGKGHGGRRK